MPLDEKTHCREDVPSTHPFTTVIFLSTDVKTDPSTKNKELPNFAVIVGIIVALVLILALIVVALFINCYPAAASSLYLIQVNSIYYKHTLLLIVLFFFLKYQTFCAPFVAT